MGIEDQARAVGALPAPHWRCSSGGFDGHSVSMRGTDAEDKKSQNPCQSKGFDVHRRQVFQKRKVEAAGIEPASRNDATDSAVSACENQSDSRAANALHCSGVNCPSLASFDTDLRVVIGAWD